MAELRITRCKFRALNLIRIVNIDRKINVKRKQPGKRKKKLIYTKMFKLIYQQNTMRFQQ